VKNRAFYFPQLKGKIESNNNRNKWLVLTGNGLPTKIPKVLLQTLKLFNYTNRDSQEGGGSGEQEGVKTYKVYKIT